MVCIYQINNQQSLLKTCILCLTQLYLINCKVCISNINQINNNIYAVFFRYLKIFPQYVYKNTQFYQNQCVLRQISQKPQQFIIQVILMENHSEIINYNILLAPSLYFSFPAKTGDRA
ncbi:hypothetical protein ABPG74_015839 [Tetrahymena malaccensis]